MRAEQWWNDADSGERKSKDTEIKPVLSPRFHHKSHTRENSGCDLKDSMTDHVRVMKH